MKLKGQVPKIFVEFQTDKTFFLKKKTTFLNSIHFQKYSKKTLSHFSISAFSLSLQEENVLENNNQGKKTGSRKTLKSSGNSVKTPTNFAAACCELKIIHLVLRDFSSLEIMASTPVVVLDRGNNTTCTINLHGCTIVSWRVNNQVRIYF